MDRRAPRLRGALALAFLGVLVTAALVSPVGAALNKNKVKNIATKTVNNLTYTESEADARFINTGEKASDSELLDGMDSGGFIQPQGLTHIVAGSQNWVAQVGGTGTAATEYSSSSVSFTTGDAFGGLVFGVSPSIPIALYGRSLQIHGVEFCYSTPNTTLDDVFLTVWSNSTAGSPEGMAAELVDDTDRTDNACRLYALSTPFTLTGDHFVTFVTRVNFGTGGGSITIGRTTFVLGGTSTTAAPLTRQGS